MKIHLEQGDDRTNGAEPLLTRSDAAPVLILITLVGVLFTVFYGKFGDLVVDSGREAMYGWRVLEGEVPYRDFFYEYGPLVPYLIAGLYKIFGISLNTLQGLGFFTAVIAAVGFYSLARTELNHLWSFFFTAVFITVFQFSFFGYYNIFNFIFPYTFTATIGFCLIIGQVLLVHRILAKPTKTLIGLCGYLAGLACLTKIEIAAASIVLHAAVAIGIGGRHRTERVPQYVLYILLGAGLSAGPILLPLMAMVDMFANLRSVLLSAASNSPFLDFVMGTRNLPGNLTAVVVSSTNILLVGIAGLAADTICERITVRGGVHRARAAGILQLAAIAALAWFLLFYRIHPFNIFRGAGIGAVIFLGLRLSRLRSMGAAVTDRKAIIGIAAAAAAIVLALKKPLTIEAAHYGFYMTPLLFLLSAILLVKEVPVLVERRYGRLNRFHLYRAGLVILLSLSVIEHIEVSLRGFAAKTQRWDSPRGTLVVREDERAAMTVVDDYFRDRPGRTGGLVVFPEGVMFNFLLGSKAVMYHYATLPQFVTTADQEAEFLSRLDEKDIRHVLLVTRWAGEFGASVFGRDYFRNGFQQLMGRFHPVIQPDGPVFGDDGRFRLMLLERRDDSDSTPIF